MRLLSHLRFHPAIAMLLLATGFSIAACRGGGGTTTPDPNRESASAPSITGVDLITGVPMTGETIQLHATATDLVTRWNWDFGTGATPQESQDAEPTVQLLAVGRHTGQVWATNGFGTSDPFVFPYSISPAIAPKLGPVAPDGLWMSTGKITRFTLPVDPAGGLPSHYEWNIAGGELVGPTNNSVVAFRASRAGTFFGWGRATNQYGEDERALGYTSLIRPKLASVELLDTSDLSRGVYGVIPTYSVFGAAHRFAYRWRLDEPYEGDLQWESVRGWNLEQLMIYPGRASRFAGSYQICEWDWNCSEPINFAFDVEPTAGSPNWTQSAIATIPTDWTVTGALELIDGKPCVVYYPYEQNRTLALHFARATTFEPRDPTDWVVHHVALPGDNLTEISRLKLLDRGGHPLISIMEINGNERLLEAKIAEPGAYFDWHRGTFNNQLSSGDRRDIAASPAGDLFVAGYEESQLVKVLRLPADADVTTDAWESHTISLPHIGYDLRITVFDGKPVIIGDQSQASNNFHFVLASTSAHPTAAGQWVNYDLSSLFNGSFSYYVGDLSAGEGHLTLAFTGPNDSLAQKGEWLLQTADPTGGATQWQVLGAPRLSDPLNLFYPTYDLVEYRNRWAQLDVAGSDNLAAVAVSRIDNPTGQSHRDWSVHMVSREASLGWYKATAASADHLYLLGIRDQTTPTLFWTTDDF